MTAFRLRVLLAALLVTTGCGTSIAEPDAGSPGPRCGDGVVQAGEACDDGNTVDSDSCRNSCALPSCGDGTIDTGEQCDDGNTSNIDACTNVCLFNVCGDTFIHAGVEVCDDGNTSNNDGCRNDCSLPVCGDGFPQPGEQCDDGNQDNTDSCTRDCKEATCGDGIVNANEQCDDGNSDNNDACTNACTLATCGDGFVQAGVESCDDGNTLDTDACLTGCIPASCGDGILHAGVESCDDGNGNDNDDCPSSCETASCGDGFVFLGHEDCDPQYSTPASCDSDCTPVACGDGLVNTAAGEQCDDGPNNSNNSDGCTVLCLAQPNTLPVVNDVSLNTDEDISLPLVLTGNDPDGESVSLSVVDGPTNGTLTGQAPNLTYVPNPDFNGQDTFTYKANDGFADSAPGTVTVIVKSVNDAPVVTGPVTGTATEDGSASALNALANASDVDTGDTLSAIQVGKNLPAGVSYDATSHSFTLDPTDAAFQSLAAGASTTVSVNYSVTDGVDSTSASISWTVTGVNDAPVATAASVDVVSGTATAVSLAGADVDTGTTLTFSVASQPAHGQLTGTAPNFTYTPNPGYTGSDSFTFTVSDGALTSAVATVALNVASACTPATFSGPGFAYELAVSPDGGHIYVGQIGDGTADVKIINTADGGITSIGGFGVIYGLALSPDGTLLVVPDSMKGVVKVIRTADEQVLATVSGFQLPSGVTFSADGLHVYVANGAGNNVMVIDTSNPNNVTAAVLNVPSGTFDKPRDVALSPDGNRLYVTNNVIPGSVTVVDLANSNAVVSTILVSDKPGMIAASTTHVYVTNGNGTGVDVIDADPLSATYHQLMTTVTTGMNYPMGLAIAPDGQHAWVANAGSANIKVLDGAVITDTLPVSGIPSGIAFQPGSNGQFAAVASWDNTVQLVCLPSGGAGNDG